MVAPNFFYFSDLLFEMSLVSSVTFSSPSSSGSSSSSSSSSPSSSSSSSSLSPPSSRTVLRASTSQNLQLKVFLGKPKINKENFEILVLKVVPVITKTRTYEGSRFWVATAVGDRQGQIGIGEHVAKTEALARKKAEKKAFRNIKSLKLFEGRTLKGKVSGGSCLVLSQAPKDVGVISTSGMASKLLELSGIRDCYVTNAWDKLTTVRAMAEALSKLSYSNRK